MARNPFAKIVGDFGGDLDKALQAEVAAGERAVTSAVRAAALGAQAELRGQVRSAGLGARLPKTIRTKLYPSSGVSLGAAGLVFSKAPQILRGFEEGATIRSKDGLFLAIPTPAAPKRGVGGKRISPSNFPEHRFGPLRFVPRPGKFSLLVVDAQRARRGKRGGFTRATVRKATRTRGEVVALSGLTTVPMFILVPQVRLKKRLDLARVGARWHRALPRLIVQLWRD